MTNPDTEPEAIKRIRAICMALPEAVERPFGGHTAPSFRVGDKLFASIYEDGTAMILKAARGVQQVLVTSHPDRFFVPKYVGHTGWVGIQLGPDLDWDEIKEMIWDSYVLIAPKRLSAKMGNMPS